MQKYLRRAVELKCCPGANQNLVTHLNNTITIIGFRPYQLHALNAVKVFRCWIASPSKGVGNTSHENKFIFPNYCPRATPLRTNWCTTWSIAGWQMYLVNFEDTKYRLLYTVKSSDGISFADRIKKHVIGSSKNTEIFRNGKHFKWDIV